MAHPDKQFVNYVTGNVLHTLPHVGSQHLLTRFRKQLLKSWFMMIYRRHMHAYVICDYVIYKHATGTELHGEQRN